jgi:hypothetical protein
MKKERDILIEAITKYYACIGRQITPQYQNYSILELQKCIKLFNIEI